MNRENINRLIGWLESDPAPHNQHTWVAVPESLKTVPVSRVVLEGICGTKVCAAGAEVAFSAPPGSLFSRNSGSEFFVPDSNGRFWFDGESGMHSLTWENAPKGNTLYRREEIEDFAVASLGITAEQGKFLFDGDRMRREIIAGLRYLLEFPDANGDELLQECT